MDEYEELTEEEIRRERERIRRRKLAARERRRKKRRQQAIIRCSLVLIVFILLIVGIVKLISGIVHLASKDNKKPKANTEQQITREPITTEEPVANIDENIIAKQLPADRETALAMLAAQGETDPDMKNIHENAAIFMDSVLQNLAINAELKEFAMSYAANINTVFNGDFTVEVPANGMPQFLQYDARWGYADYGKELIATGGAAPTCLSMVYTYLKKDGSMNPVKMADYIMESGYLSEEGNTSWSLMTDGIKELGLVSEELTLSKENLKDALDSEKGIICAVGEGDFTKDKHFIVIREFKDGFFYVNDPFSKARSDVGWDYKRLSSQITGVWAFTSNGAATAGDNTNTGDGANDTNDTGTDGTDNNGTGGGDNNDAGNASNTDHNAE